MDKYTATLFNPQQAYQVIQAVWASAKAQTMAGNKLTLTLEDEPKSREVEKKYHAMIGEIAKQAQHLGARWDAESWKRFLLWQYAKDAGIDQGQIVPSLDGTGIIQLGIQSRKFTKEQASNFVEWLHAWGAQNGITFKESEE